VAGEEEEEEEKEEEEEEKEEKEEENCLHITRQEASMHLPAVSQDNVSATDTYGEGMSKFGGKK
jgi:hypothetical protein